MIDPETAAVLAQFHEITTRVILPAKAKGAAFAAQAAAQFMKLQSSNAEPVVRAQPLRDCGVAAVCRSNNAHLPV